MPSGARVPVFENTFARDLPDMFEPWAAAVVERPELLVLNESLAREVGFDPEWLRTTDGVRFLLGNLELPGIQTVAQGYAGHQFGGFSPRLGDGRALLLGEVIDGNGSRRDLHLKGSGRTRFSRGGDGKAAVGPMLREHVIGEAMLTLGIPTTRALAVVATNELIPRDEMLPGAVLCRVASSHLRVGSFQYAATMSHDHVRRLADYAIERHYPLLADADDRYLAFLDAVMDRQAFLIAKWMSIGFIHGVMNTDNMTISGETIDYGPCAFMDTYSPTTVFSSIDHQGRYAFGNQPHIAQWNLARLAETLLPLLHSDKDESIRIATGAINLFPARFEHQWELSMRAKLGLTAEAPVDTGLFHSLLTLFENHHIDFTNGMRALSDVVRGRREREHALFDLPLAFDTWARPWLDALSHDPRDANDIADAMDAVNPAYIPRNHVVETALAAASTGDLTPLDSLMDVLLDPFHERDGLEEYTRPMPSDWDGYQTFCGT
ncbi:MAG: YdiU family protein [Actinobacteria bacterium]|nr:YdiU family protein [Actinomycetota bacterium]